MRCSVIVFSVFVILEMSEKCKTCQKVISARQVKVQCTDCLLYFHGSCVKLTKEDVEFMQSDGQIWRCEICGKERRKSMQVESKLDESQPRINDVIKLLNEMRQENKDQIKKLETDLGNSVENCHQTIDELKVTIQTQTESLKKYEKMYDTLFEENRKLHLRVKELERREDESDQYSRINCLEINGIPESENENVLQIIKNVGDSLDIVVAEESVDACHRLGAKRVNDVRPRSIIVKFTRRLVKEEFLKKRRVKRNLNTLDIGFTNRPADVVFINESLTKARREVYKEVRELKKKKGFSFVWVRNGKILVRPTEGARVIPVTTMDDVEKLRDLPSAPGTPQDTGSTGTTTAH